jgi:hypothetical protein
MTFSQLDCSFSIDRVEITPETFDIVLSDGRIIPTPRKAFKRLAHATDEQLAKWHGDLLGIGIHWDDLDEDLLIYPLIEEAEKTGRIRYLNAS